jgi:hypothetical protein
VAGGRAGGVGLGEMLEMPWAAPYRVADSGLKVGAGESAAGKAGFKVPLLRTELARGALPTLAGWCPR